MLFSSVYPIENSNFTSYKAKCTIKSSLKKNLHVYVQESNKKTRSFFRNRQLFDYCKKSHVQIQMYNVLVMYLHLRTLDLIYMKEKLSYNPTLVYCFLKCPPVLTFDTIHSPLYLLLLTTLCFYSVKIYYKHGKKLTKYAAAQRQTVQPGCK